ncbi:MAG: hypothetical protein EPO07_19630 [Verrucomicrobia bacterium]|nr:MAG: hypothetical protein EPO07_19630 [Verrucomicrobiota bacterium]
MYLLLLMLVLFLAAFFVGLFWRWHVLWLAMACALSGFVVFLCMSDWSDFDLKAIIADLHRYGSAAISWLVHFAIGFIFSATPTVLGGVAGWGVRRWRNRSKNRISN